MSNSGIYTQDKSAYQVPKAISTLKTGCVIYTLKNIKSKDLTTQATPKLKLSY